MKKVAILFVAAGLMFGLNSCKKEKCGTCSTESIVNGTSYGSTSVEACGDAYEELDGMETTSTVNGVTTTSKTTCVED